MKPNPIILILIWSVLIGLTVDMVKAKSVINITNHFASAKFKSNEYTIHQIFSDKLDNKYFKTLERYGLGESGYTYWYKGILPKQGLPVSEYFIEIPYAMLGKVNIWFYDEADQLIEFQAGSEYQFSNRVIQDGSFVFPVPSAVSATRPIVISIETSTSVSFSALLWEKSAWQENQLNTHMWYGFFFGCLLVLIFYNLFLSSALKDISYIYYILYLIGLSLINAIGAGHLDQFVFSENAGKMESIFQLIIAITIVFDTLFINRFLEVKKQFPLAWKFSVGVMWLIVMLAIPEALGFTSENNIDELLISGVILLTNISLFYYLIISIVSYRKGMVKARFIVLAFSFLLISYVIYRLYTFQFIEYGFFVRHLLEFGTLAEGILLSLALADRINLLSIEKENIEKKSHTLQQTITKRLIHAQELERESFSNEMHASVGHSLLVMKQNLDRAYKQAIDLHHKNDDKRQQEISETIHQQSNLCAKLMNEVRHLSQDLHPHILKRLGLKKAIEAALQEAFSKRDIEWQAHIDQLPLNIENEKEITIYRLVQQSIRKVLRNPDLTEVIFLLKTSDDSITIEIKDDGIVNRDSLEIESDISRIRGRIELFNGWLKVGSFENDGTHLTFAIPLS